MQRINPYLNFPGTCKQAVEHYAKVLGGTIEMMQTNGESPMKDQMPPERHNDVIHARLRIGDDVIMASDAPPQYFEKQQGLWVSFQADSVEHGEKIWAGLAEGGEVRMPFAETFWAPRFGMVIDRFGTPWMVNVEHK